ncbi:hypothetical protein EMA8858_00103 [Emticicia aquatica]|uniref:DUF1003 domain-containing protein n=1 Tax=Emticicia aquatica TaxID=1681835 RepID=A0ABN8EQ20_9BACT|nr:DUF1003 domain-containing protein [Emticicia aquatica]CAH0993996.1 hypothetical protein EMA8858_00103 [Emticicia aquatica]
MDSNEIDKILNREKEHLSKLQKIVDDTIREEQLIVNNLLNPPKEVLSRGQEISDKVALFGGSWKFIILFAVILTVWIIINATLPEKDRFDPYPFILMNLILSTIAALQAPIIMMSQNRQEEKDRMRSENDYLINLKAEMEIRSLHQKIDLLLEDQIKTLFDTQAKQFTLLEEINSKLENHLKKQA